MPGIALVRALKKTVLITVSLLIALNTFGNNLDSLTSEYDKAKNQTLKCKIALSIANKYDKSTPDEKLFWSKKALQHSAHTHDTLKQAISLNKIAICFLHKSEVDSTELYFDRALERYWQTGKAKRILKCTNSYGSFLQTIGKYYKAHDIYAQLLELDELSQNDKKRLSIYQVLAFTKIQTCEYDRALYYALKFEELNFKNDSSQQLLPLFVKLVISDELDDIDKMSHYVNEIKALADDDNKNMAFLIYHEAMASLAAEQEKDYHKAIEHLDTAYQKNVRDKNDEQIAYNAIYLGHCYSKLEQYDKAELFFQIATEKITALGINKKLFELYANQSQHFLDKGEYSKAIAYGERAIELHKDFGLLHELPDIYKTLSDIYKSKKQYAQAYEYLQKHNEYKDSTLNLAQINSIKYLEHDYLEKENMLEIQKLEYANLQKAQKLSNQTKIVVFLVIISIILVILAITLIYYFKQKHQNIIKEQEIAEIKSMLIGQERERERIAKDLHDGIVSDITGLKTYLNRLSTGDNAELNTVVKKLTNISKEVRIISHNLASPMFLESSFDEVLDTYTQQFSHSGELEIKTMYYPKINWENIPTNIQLELYRAIQEIINNTIKHAEATKLTIQLVKHDDMINVTIEDNGRGFLKEFAGSGKGLQNIKDRIESLNGELTIESAPKKSSVFIIDIPLNLVEEKQIG